MYIMKYASALKGENLFICNNVHESGSHYTMKISQAKKHKIACPMYKWDSTKILESYQKMGGGIKREKGKC